MSREELIKKIEDLIKDPVEWDSLLLARHLVVILTEIVNGGGPGPGPTPALDKCVQVDHPQDFSEAEKARGRTNLGVDISDFVPKLRKIVDLTLENDITPQQVQDAIKELTAILKNKTVDADDNTILNLETDNFKNDALAKSTDEVRSLDNSVDTKLATEKFLQKTLHNVELPEEDKDAANKKYVDDLVAKLEGEVLKFKGFVSPTAPTGSSIKNGSFWYQGNAMPSTFPINVKTYNATTGQWSTATSEYTPDALDLWANLNDNKGYYWFGNAWNMLDDNGKVMFVSTFEGLTGDEKMLYYLDTAYGDYKAGFYRYNGLTYVNINPKNFFYVSTFNGVVGDEEALYYLDTAYDNYKKGFYRFIPAAGTDPAKFELIGSDVEVFTDVDELPSTNISKATIYRLPYIYYEYQGQKVEKEDIVFYAPGPQCLNMAADSTGLHIEDSSRSYSYTWEQVNDTLVQQLIADGIAIVKDAYADAEFFRLAADSYGPKDELHEVEGGYKLYHNPTETDGEYIEIGGEESPFVAGTGLNSAVLNGGNNVAEGDNSVAEGKGTKTNNDGEHAEGKFNYSYKANVGEEDFATRHSVGIGTSDADRKNAVEILANGEMFLHGAGGYDGTNMRQGSGADMKINPAVKSVQDILRNIPIKEQQYLRIDTPVANAVLSVRKTGDAPATEMEYSLDGETWTKAAIPFRVTFSGVIYLRGENEAYASSESKYTTIEVLEGANQAPFSLSGNIMSLVYGANVFHRSGLQKANVFRNLFARTKVENAGALILPTVVLSDNCYRSMFYGCTSLATAPALPATQLAAGCYREMFYGCTSLATAPALPAIQLAADCYQNMFNGCTSLSGAPALPAIQLAPNCYYGMFRGCASLATAPALPAIQLAPWCYRSMFYGCASLATAPALPATQLAPWCYAEMFNGCTSLSGAPDLPATQLAADCYQNMFNGCTSLSGAPALPATQLADSCYQSMFQDCASLATAPALLPATQLADSCYQNMFYGCASLATAPALPATQLAVGCYQSMFNGCTSLSGAPALLPATQLADSCYQSMFRGCTSLVQAPALPAIQLAADCYNNMFRTCRSLNYVKILAEDISARDALFNWLNGVSATGTFMKKTGVAFPSGASGIPAGWTVIEVDDAGKVFTDVDELPSTDIDKDTIYRTRDVSYEYEGVRFPKSELVWYGPGPDCTSMDADDVGVNIRAASGNRSYPWGSVNAALIQELRDLNLVAVGVDEADAVFFSHSATYGPKSGLTTIYGDYRLYHNPSQTAGGYIEIGGDGDSVQYVSTFAGVTGDTSALYYLDTAYDTYKVGFYRFNGTFQYIGTDVILTVLNLPTTGISRTVFYRLVEYHKYDMISHEEIPVENTFMSNNQNLVVQTGGIEYSSGGQTHFYSWNELTDAIITEVWALGYLKHVPLSVWALDGKFFKKDTNVYESMYGPMATVYEKAEYKLYHNPTETDGEYIEIGGGSEGDVFTDVNTLPTTGISKNTIYRMPVDKYYEDGTVLPATPTGYVSIRPAIVIIDETGITDNGTHYAWADITDAQMDFWVIRRQISEVYAADLMTNSTCFKTAANHYVYKDHVTKGQVYELYHNPTATANAFIKIGGEESSSVEVDEVTTEEVNGKVQANAVIEVDSLPTTGIKTKSLYRRMTQVYRHDGVEVNSVSPYKVRPNDTLEATPDGLRYKPDGPTVAWDASNIAQVVSDGIRDGYIEATTWENAEFFGYGDDPTSGNFDYKNHFSRLLPGSLWQNPTGTAAGWEEVGKDPVIDEVTIVEENSILQAVAVIDVTTLPSVGMKVNSLYRKVETVMVPGLHIYTTYYHGGADPVPEPVECYKPARAGVEFRTNEIYIDGVQRSYEELKVYKADWVAAGYIVACDFLDIDTTTNDGAVGYPNEGSYQFLNRARYTYNTDPVPVVMNKIFQRTPGGEWESISTVQLSNAAYNELDYDQKMDGTTYIVEG